MARALADLPNVVCVTKRRQTLGFVFGGQHKRIGDRTTSSLVLAARTLLVLLTVLMFTLMFYPLPPAPVPLPTARRWDGIRKRSARP